jgi:simple sugar transport system ATP-binding protein
MMVGIELATPAARAHELGDVALKIDALTVSSPNPFGTSLKNISLDLKQGEVLGIGGVAGNGQDELLAALSGELRTASDAVQLKGRPVGHLGPNERRELGLLAAPEERLGHAAAPDMSLIENAALSGWVRKEMVSRNFINWGKARRFADEIIAGFDVRTPGSANPARSLSGGNLQKFVIGREILQQPDVLVVNQPTWGVDASAAAAIRQALLDLAAGGAAVLVISQDLDELMEVASRFAALNEGKLTDPRPTHDLSIDEIGLMMGGAHGMEAAHDPA